MSFETVKIEFKKDDFGNAQTAKVCWNKSTESDAKAKPIGASP